MPPFLDHGLNNYSRLSDASFLLARIMPQNNLTPSQCTDPSNDPSKKTVQASTVRKSFAIKDLRIGVTGFEPAASTSRTKPHSEEHPVNHLVNQADAERLHHCLHQIGEMIENYGSDSLADALAQVLGEEPIEKLAEALMRRLVNR